MTFAEQVSQFRHFQEVVSKLHRDHPAPDSTGVHDIAEKVLCQCQCAKEAMQILSDEEQIIENDYRENVEQFIELLKECEILLGDILQRKDIAEEADMEILVVAKRHARERIERLEKRIPEEEIRRQFMYAVA